MRVPTLDELLAYRGEEGILRIPSAGAGSQKQPPLYARVRVVDARYAAQRIHLLVTPLGGSGEQWVWLSRVQLDKERLNEAARQVHNR
jgi:hypothetical protein